MTEGRGPAFSYSMLPIPASGLSIGRREAIMCVAAPMRLIEVQGEEGRAELDGVTRTVSLALLDSAAPGDYVLIHAGFAIAKLDEEEARLTLEAIAACGEGEP
jgi:hydrogenase expression/formation protein HypC